MVENSGTEVIRSFSGAGSALDAVGFVGFWECDFATGQTRASPAVDRLFGMCVDASQAPSNYMDYELRIHPDDVEWVRRERPLSIGPSGIGVIEYRVLDGAGDVRWVSCRARYKRSASGDLVGGLGVIFDVTQSRLEGQGTRSSATVPLHPVERIADLLLEALALAKQMDAVHLVTAISDGLMATGWLLSARMNDVPV